MNFAPIDYRTAFGPNCPPPPGLTCDGCRKNLPYGETVCWSDASKDLDFCEQCIHDGQDDDPDANLVKTTVKERCQPRLDREVGMMLLSQMFQGPPPNVTRSDEPSISYEMRDQEGGSLGTFEAFGPPSGELLSAVMQRYGAVGMERQEPNDSRE